MSTSDIHAQINMLIIRRLVGHAIFLKLTERVSVVGLRNIRRRRIRMDNRSEFLNNVAQALGRPLRLERVIKPKMREAER